MPDIDSASDDDGSSSDPPSESSDFAPTNWHGAANAGGPAAADARQKRHEANQVPDHKKATNRGNLAWLSHIINSIPSVKKEIICGYGFPFVFHLNSSGAPRSFAQWIDDHIQPESSDIIVESGTIHLGPDTFSDVIGFGNSGLDVKVDFEGAKEQFLSLMGFSELPTIKQLGKMLLTNDLANDKYFICFMVVFLSSFFVS